MADYCADECVNRIAFAYVYIYIYAAIHNTHKLHNAHAVWASKLYSRARGMREDDITVRYIAFVITSRFSRKQNNNATNVAQQ